MIDHFALGLTHGLMLLAAAMRQLSVLSATPLTPMEARTVCNGSVPPSR